MVLASAEAGGAPAGALRILLVVDGFYPSTGGSEMQVRLLARAFTAAGHHVEIVAPQLDTTMATSERLDGIEVTRIAYPHVRIVGALWLCVCFAAWLWRRRNRIDAIHVHMAKNLAAVAGLMRPYMRPTLTIKISGAWEFSGGILDPKLRDKPLYRLYNAGVRRADTMQCISAYTRQRLADTGYPPERLRLIANAVDLARFAPAEQPQPRAGGRAHVAFVGRIEPVKGLVDLLAAWSRYGLAAKARLTIAGYGTQKEALIEAARSSGILDSVDFPGEIHDVPALLRTADLYVQCSYEEGLANSVLEAMAMGLPIVATRISGNVDVVADNDNGLLVPPGDPEALGAALQRLIDDPALAAAMGKRSRVLVEQRFGIPAITAQLEAAYRGTPAAA